MLLSVAEARIAKAASKLRVLIDTSLTNGAVYVKDVAMFRGIVISLETLLLDRVFSLSPSRFCSRRVFRGLEPVTRGTIPVFVAEASRIIHGTDAERQWASGNRAFNPRITVTEVLKEGILWWWLWCTDTWNLTASTDREACFPCCLV